MALNNMEAIESATRVGAEAIGVEKTLGTVEVGKLADMIIVAEDPLKDITTLKRVGWVMKGGEVVGLLPRVETKTHTGPTGDALIR